MSRVRLQLPRGQEDGGMAQVEGTCWHKWVVGEHRWTATRSVCRCGVRATEEDMERLKELRASIRRGEAVMWWKEGAVWPGRRRRRNAAAGGELRPDAAVDLVDEAPGPEAS